MSLWDVPRHWKEKNGPRVNLRMKTGPATVWTEALGRLPLPLSAAWVTEESGKARIGLMWIMDALSSEGVGLPHSYSWEGGWWVDRAWTDHLLTILCDPRGQTLLVLPLGTRSWTRRYSVPSHLSSGILSLRFSCGLEQSMVPRS